jgi:hypothetical protein
MSTTRIRQGGAVALAGVSAIHLLLAPEYFGEQAYIGVLFVLGGIAAAGAALMLWRTDHPASWGLGSLIAAGMGIGFVLSRTVGLPGFHESEWELSGLISLVLEAGFLVAAAAWARGLVSGGERQGLAA